jgi:hypothetical protein
MIDNVSLTPKKDLSFFHNLPENELMNFFRLLGISDFIISPEVKKEMLFFMNILSWRNRNAMEVEVVRMAPQYKNFDNPFLALQNELEELAADFEKDNQLQLSSKTAVISRLKFISSNVWNL